VKQLRVLAPVDSLDVHLPECVCVLDVDLGLTVIVLLLSVSIQDMLVLGFLPNCCNLLGR